MTTTVYFNWDNWTETEKKFNSEEEAIDYKNQKENEEWITCDEFWSDNCKWII